VIWDETEAWRIEELLLNATQPAQQLQYDGWLLRLAQNDVKRASSVNPIYGSSLPLDEKLAHCEDVYADHGLPPLYRLTPFAKPAGLEEALERRGYQSFERSLSMSMSLDAPLPETRGDLRFERPQLDRWLDLASEMRRLTPDRRRAERARLFESTLPGFAVVAWQGEEAVGCGFVMLEDDYAGLFDIATVETRRGQGIGRATCVHLLQLAQQQGAERAWLSVVADNAPAVHLYEELGFARVYDYWYRIKRS
jgi:ribosomal protein S18 acetylase RimI-like enzyme